MTTELLAVRNKRGTSLRWILDLPQLHVWQTSVNGTKENVLWIQGGPGIGKSTMIGYFIDYLKANIPDSHVLYAFCKRGINGLTGACDILQNLAYQFSLIHTDVRSKLEDIKGCNLSPAQNGGIDGLFDELIRTPLGQISKTTFVVLDGMDEADWEAQDCVYDKTEMEVLLDNLVSLTNTSSVRLLMSTRPACRAAKYAEKGVVKIIEYGAKDEDIRIYIDTEISRNDALRNCFEAKRWINYDEILNGARGIFLWVESLIKELRNVTDSKEDFRECLDNFLKASGSDKLERLWLTVLKMVHYKKRCWVKETLMWVVIARRNLDISELRTAVELSMNGSLDDFVKFLEDHCSSLLRITESSQVQLTHETLRSFLLKKVETLTIGEEAPGNLRD